MWLKIKKTFVSLLLLVVICLPVSAQDDPLILSYVALSKATRTLLSSLELSGSAEDAVAALESYNDDLVVILPALREAERISPYGGVSSIDDLPPDVKDVVEEVRATMEEFSGRLQELLAPYMENGPLLQAWNKMGRLFITNGRIDES